MSRAFRQLLLHPWRCAAISLLLCALAAIVGFGTGIEGFQAVTRYTGRAGLLWFGLIFALAPWHRLFPGELSRLALRRRRQLGLAFGGHHTVHLGLLLAYRSASGNDLDLSRAAGGAFGYLLLFAMMATSTDAAVRRLGPTNWRRLHRTGLWYLWLVFLLTYLPRIQGTATGAGGGMAEFAVCITLLLGLGVFRAGVPFVRRFRPLKSPDAV